jgi:hypothetical protein
MKDRKTNQVSSVWKEVWRQISCTMCGTRVPVDAALCEDTEGFTGVCPQCNGTGVSIEKIRILRRDTDCGPSTDAHSAEKP